MKRRILRIVLAVAIAFALFNAAWFVWSHIKYGNYPTAWKLLNSTLFWAKDIFIRMPTDTTIW